MLTRDQLINLIDQHDLSEHKDFILQHSKPAIHLIREYVRNEDDLPIGASKIGGNPDLPADFEWQYYKGQPLSFLAQIKLSDVKPYDVDDVLPDLGWLYFFYEIDHGKWWGISQTDGFQVYYTNVSDAQLQRTPHPTSTRKWGEIKAFNTYRINFSLVWMPTLANSAYQYFSAYSTDHKNPPLYRYFDLIGSIDKEHHPAHYLLGNYHPIQGDVGEEAFINLKKASTPQELNYQDFQWRLLFQMDSDGDFNADYGWHFGDRGILYFVMDEKDLLAWDLNKTIQIVQSL